MSERFKIEQPSKRPNKNILLENPADNFEGDIEKNKKIILEIGCGSEPYFFETLDKPRIRKDEHYIGLDLANSGIQDQELKQTIEKMEKLGRIEGKVDFIAASGEKLPLKDKSADKIILRNVFGAPYTFFTDKYPKNKEEFKNWTNNPVIRNLLENTKYENNYLKDTRIDQVKKIFNKNPNFWISEFQFKNNTAFNPKQQKEWDTLRYFLQAITAYIKLEMIKEIKRVLKNGGELIIIEEKTAEVADEYMKDLKNDLQFETLHYEQSRLSENYLTSMHKDQGRTLSECHFKKKML